MFKILKTEKLSELVWRFRIEAPRIARKRQAGQFIIIRPDISSERIPLTIANADISNGWIEIIFQVVGYTTAALAKLQQGDCVLDLAGPLGNPTHIDNFGSCLCIGGGVGVAPLFPIICSLHNKGNKVTSIIGARNKDLLILTDEIASHSNVLHVTTDDGSSGKKGFVSDIFNELKSQGYSYDIAFVIGPAVMMKAVSSLTIDAGIRTVVSLNPIMIDGTGMCGGCRIRVNNEIKFACIDGPEFDAASLDWSELLMRLGAYRQFEHDAKNAHQCRIDGR